MRNNPGKNNIKSPSGGRRFRRPSDTGRITAFLLRDDDGDAVVEAVILFPIMIMIFAALVLLAVYLPTRAALQRATQYAATALAVKHSDTWLFFDEGSLSYYWENDKTKLKNVYEALFSGFGDIASNGEEIVIGIEGGGISSKAGKLDIECYPVDQFVYKEVVVTASREYAVPVNLSFIGFPDAIKIAVSSTAVVQDGDEFVRNVDLASDFAGYISKKFGLTDISGSISDSLGKAAPFLSP